MHAESASSTTAMLIAASIASSRASGEAQSRIPATTIAFAQAALRQGGPVWRLIGGGVRFAAFRALCRALEQIALPGIQCHFLARKQRLREWRDEAVAHGFDQCLVLGAGFDGLAADFASGAGDPVACEWDHPATQAIKRTIIDRLGAARPNLMLQAVDIGKDDIPSALDAAGLQRHRATFIVAEGLAMYLERARWEALLDAIDAWFAGRIRVAFGYMELQADGRPDFARANRGVRGWLRRRGEPFLWGSDIGQMKASWQRRGYTMLDLDDGTTPPSPPLSRWTPCPGETYCLVEREAR